ncbi:MAG: alpha/beta fold hydrolase [Ignavibacteria bacterium]|nr:alpha/beta fold hydrolase [Ignavibacteria bacterium]
MEYSQFRKRQLFFSSSQGKLKYIDQGQGEVIVLLHGVPTSSWLYRKMINELASHYRVIAPDMLGFGSSDSPKGYDIYAPMEHARRLLELMDHLQIEKWNQVFHDAGGLWTWELMAFASHRIKRLVILNTIIYAEGFNPPIKFKKGFFTRCIMAMYSNGISTNLMLKGLFNSGLMKNTLTKEELQGYKKPLLEGKTKAMYHFFSNTCRKLPDYEEIIKNINVPKLLIWGEHDSFLVFNEMKNKVIADLRLDEENIHLLNAKHFIQEEEHHTINKLILKFLKSDHKA